MLTDGGPGCHITVAGLTTISFWEMEVQPPGISGGDPIEIVTQHSVAWRRKAPRSLKTLEPFDVTAGYDPNIFSQLLAIINSESTMTNRWNDGSTLAYYGFVQDVEYDPLQEGELPTMTITICPTNADPTTGAEEGPVYTNVAGT